MFDAAFRDRLRDAFSAAFGGDGGRCFQASGRVNLIGAHVDYHGGPVLPVAVDRGVLVLARGRDDRRVRLGSLDFPEVHEWDLDAAPEPARQGWSAYPLGVFRVLEERGAALPGMDLWFGGTVPLGAGMSSSAAILVATACAVSTLAGERDSTLPPGLGGVDLARVAHEAETRHVGVQCGIMDQYASALARPDSVLYLDCRSREFESIPVPPGEVSLVVLDSMQRHELTDGLYNQRVAESGAALAALREGRPGIEGYRDLTSVDLSRHDRSLDDVPRRRARHVVLEIERVLQARQALVGGDWVKVGELMNQSHLSSRYYYETTTPRLDALFDAAVQQPAVHGARVTGAGFGGGLLVLVRHGHADEVIAPVARAFEEQFGEKPRHWELGFGEAPGECRPDHTGTHQEPGEAAQEDSA